MRGRPSPAPPYQDGERARLQVRPVAHFCSRSRRTDVLPSESHTGCPKITPPAFGQTVKTREGPTQGPSSRRRTEREDGGQHHPPRRPHGRRTSGPIHL